MRRKFTEYFSKQARRPSGFFGRFIMSKILAKGNAPMNGLVEELMSVKGNDQILEIGFGPGKLMNGLARHLDQGTIEGIDFSSTMVTAARKRNKNFLTNGRVKIRQGHFDEMPFNDKSFDKICSVHTIYFWPNPEKTIQKIFGILKPDGILFLGFEAKIHLEKKEISKDVFNLYSEQDVKDLLTRTGFSAINVHSIALKSTKCLCIVATK